MPNPIWPMRSVCQLTLIATAFNNMVVNSHHFHAGTARESTLTNDQAAIDWAAEVAADWVANLKTAWLAAHNNVYTLNMVKVQVIERPGNWRHKLTATELPQTTSNVGTSPATSSSSTEAAVIRWRTTSAGKRSRGRTYVAPVPDSWMTAGLVNATGLSSYNAYGTAMIARWGVGGSDYNDQGLTIYSRPYNEGEYQYTVRQGGNIVIVIPAEYEGNATNVSAHHVDAVVRNQRKRQIGVGS